VEGGEIKRECGIKICRDDVFIWESA